MILQERNHVETETSREQHQDDEYRRFIITLNFKFEILTHHLQQKMF